MIFATCSHYGNHANPNAPRRDYLGDVDDLALFCPALGAVYLVPIDDLQTTTYGTLRIEPPRNGQRKRIRLAAAYEVARIGVY